MQLSVRAQNVCRSYLWSEHNIDPGYTGEQIVRAMEKFMADESELLRGPYFIGRITLREIKGAIALLNSRPDPAPVGYF